MKSLQITLEERLHCSCSGLLVLTLDGKLYGIAALNAESHHAHDALGIDFLFRAGDHDFRGKLACLLDQQSGRSSVDTQCIRNRIFNGLHLRITSFPLLGFQVQQYVACRNRFSCHGFYVLERIRIAD